MMIRIVSMSYVPVIVALAFGVVQVKSATGALDERRTELAGEITGEKERIRLLEMEWAARSDAKTIADLTERYLPHMRPTAPEQLVVLSDIPLRRDPATIGEETLDDLLSRVGTTGSVEGSAARRNF